MNKKEAIKAMLQGKKVRRKSWFKNDYFYFNEEDQIFYDNNGTEAKLNYEDKCDWEIYEEPKKKVDLYLWAVKLPGYYPKSKGWMSTNIYYPDVESVLKAFDGHVDLIKRLDYTKITVEE